MSLPLMAMLPFADEDPRGLFELPLDDPPEVVAPRSWAQDTLVGFDLETTGIDPLADRIVTAAVVHIGPSGEVLPASRSWLVDPGVAIPSEATAVHGIDTARARQAGIPAPGAVGQILAALEQVWTAGLPVVVFNAPYDLTLLNAELVRHGFAALEGRETWRRARIVDPLVLDRRADRFRRGQRTLQVAARHYGVPARDAHSSFGDAAAAGAVAREIAWRFPFIGAADPDALHLAQRGWYRDWAANFADYLRRLGRADADVDGHWPLRPAAGGRPVALP